MMLFFLFFTFTISIVHISSMHITFFKKKIDPINNNFYDNSIKDVLFKFFPDILNAYSSKYFFCKTHFSETSIGTQEKYIEEFFMLIAFAEVISCTSNEYYTKLKPVLTQARYELAYLLCVDWLPNFNALLHQAEVTNKYVDLKISIPFVARFIGYYLAQEHYEGYNETLRCNAGSCKNLRTIEGKWYANRNEQLKVNIQWTLNHLICFCFIYSNNIFSNTIHGKNDVPKEFISQLHYFTMNLLKIFSIYREKKYDITGLIQWVERKEEVQFSTNYTEKSFDYNLLYQTEFFQLIKKNGIYIIAQTMGEGHYEHATFRSISDSDIRRFVLCPQNDAHNYTKLFFATLSRIFEVKKACFYTCLFLFLMYHLFFKQ